MWFPFFIRNFIFCLKCSVFVSLRLMIQLMCKCTNSSCTHTIVCQQILEFGIVFVCRDERTLVITEECGQVNSWKFMFFHFEVFPQVRITANNFFKSIGTIFYPLYLSLLV